MQVKNSNLGACHVLGAYHVHMFLESPMPVQVGRTLSKNEASAIVGLLGGGPALAHILNANEAIVMLILKHTFDYSKSARISNH